jgi:methionyl-tRNA formyltransferase
VILCNYLNSNYARAVLRAFRARGMRQVNIVAAVGAPSVRTIASLWQKYRFALPRVVLRSIATRLAGWTGREQDRNGAGEPSLEAETIAQGGKFVVVHEINGEEGCSVLRSMGTDLLVLAGTPIIRAAVLAVPRIGTLNAHQGALPKFRGMNVIEWAIFENSPPTISIHFVDPGVDTGDIIVDEAVSIRPGDTVTSVRERASALQVDMLADATAAVLARRFSRRAQRPEEGRQYFTMHPCLRAIAERRLQQKIGAPANG